MEMIQTIAHFGRHLKKVSGCDAREKSRLFPIQLRPDEEEKMQLTTEVEKRES